MTWFSDTLPLPLTSFLQARILVVTVFLPLRLWLPHSKYLWTKFYFLKVYSYQYIFFYLYFSEANTSKSASVDPNIIKGPNLLWQRFYADLCSFHWYIPILTVDYNENQSMFDIYLLHLRLKTSSFYFILAYT